MKRQSDFPKLSPVGDSALLLELSDDITLAVNDRIRALDSCLRDQPLEGIREWVPGYSSLLVLYDPTILDFPTVESHVMICLNVAATREDFQSEPITIPVLYGGEGGPDLQIVADAHSLSPSEVVRLHASSTYRVGMMGFTPGFAYLMGLPPSLATPRRASPRTQVPAGSVGIAGSQTGIYPLESPGGWQLIGRTAWILYDPKRACPFLLSPGAEVRFQPLAEGVMP